MKKRLSLILLFCSLAVFAFGCAEKDGGTGATEDAATQPVEVDVDLTLISSTMVMGEVSNIMNNAEDYFGKTIRIIGPYITSYYEKTGAYYHYVMVDACCTGFEFILNGERTYPDDYPAERTIIEITGVFGSYEELGQTYYYLAVDDIEF